MQPERPPEGFATDDGRLVYSIIFSLECSPPRSLQLIVPLDANGNSKNGRTLANDLDKRIVNVLPGDALRFNHKRFVVTTVAAYRWAKDGVAHGWS